MRLKLEIRDPRLGQEAQRRGVLVDDLAEAIVLAWLTQRQLTSASDMEPWIEAWCRGVRTAGRAA